MSIVIVGIPVHNGEKSIKKAINSVLNQTLQDFEIIISDNASTDLTKNICEEYAKNDIRIKYIRQKKNLGYVENVCDCAHISLFRTYCDLSVSPNSEKVWLGRYAMLKEAASRTDSINWRVCDLFRFVFWGHDS